jgi:hypothetical protein
MYILYNQRDATYTMLFIIISALHVLGGISAHHQELIKLVWIGWNSSTPSTPAVDSMKASQYSRLHIVFFMLMRMAGKTTRNM